MPSRLRSTSIYVNDTQNITGTYTDVIEDNSRLSTSGAVKRLLDSLLIDSFVVNGEWTNKQYPGRTPDPAGLEFIVTYRDGHEANVIANLISPDKWREEPGMQIASFSYTENGTTVVGTKAAGVEVAPTSLAVNGDMVTQFYDEAPNLSGLTFTITYNNGQTITTQSVPVSPATWGATGTQTALFSYTEDEVTVSASKECTVVRKISSLTVGGGWANPQFLDEAPDITGLTFTVNYNNGTSAVLQPSEISVLPEAWLNMGQQAATFSYTENGVTVSATKTANVLKKAEILTYSGTWGEQREGQSVNTSGITFIVSYNDGTSSTITPAVSPSTWSTNMGEQTATFSYTENGVTVSATKTLGMTYNITMLTNESTYGTTSIDTNTYVYSELVQTRTLSYSIANSNIYQFNSWSTEVGSVSGDALNIPANAHGNFSVTGNFGLQTFTITVRSNNTSKGTVSGDLTYSYSASDQTMTVTATPLTNYRFVSWSVSGPSSGTITVSGSTLTIGAGAYGNATVTATFTADSRGWKPPNVQFVFMSRPNTGSYPGILYEDEACEIPVTLESKLYNGSNATFYTFKNSRVSYMLTYLSRVTNQNAYTSSNWSDSYMSAHLTACRTFRSIIGSNGYIWSNKFTEFINGIMLVYCYVATLDEVNATYNTSYSSYPTYIPINYTMTLT